MSKTNNVEFPQLNLKGDNYLVWCLDVELHLMSQKLEDTIVKDKVTTPAQKASALCFIRHHMMEALKTEYLTVRDPLVLWDRLRARYGHQRDVILPRARNDWSNLRFQDFATVAEYNSAMHNIASQRALCGDVIDEATMIDKTLSTFSVNSILLQQQYRNQNFRTHAELISVLLLAEQNNALLVRNNDMRPAGSKAVPEAHGVSVRGRNDGRGRGRGRGGGRGQGRGNKPGIGFLKPQRNIGKAKRPTNKDDKCNNCGKPDHWARDCPEAPQRGPHRKGGKPEAHHVDVLDARFQTTDFFQDQDKGAPNGSSS